MCILPWTASGGAWRACLGFTDKSGGRKGEQGKDCFRIKFGWDYRSFMAGFSRLFMAGFSRLFMAGFSSLSVAGFSSSFMSRFIVRFRLEFMVRFVVKSITR